MNFKDILNLLKTWKFWKELIIMTLGMLVTAAALVRSLACDERTEEVKG